MKIMKILSLGKDSHGLMYLLSVGNLTKIYEAFCDFMAHLVGWWSEN